MKVIVFFAAIFYVLSAVWVYRAVTSKKFFRFDAAAIYCGIGTFGGILYGVFGSGLSIFVWSILLANLMSVVIYVLLCFNLGLPPSARHNNGSSHGSVEAVSDYLSYEQEKALERNADLIDRLESSYGGVNTPHDIYDADRDVDYSKLETNNEAMQTEIDLSRD